MRARPRTANRAWRRRAGRPPSSRRWRPAPGSMKGDVKRKHSSLPGGGKIFSLTASPLAEARSWRRCTLRSAHEGTGRLALGTALLLTRGPLAGLRLVLSVTRRQEQFQLLRSGLRYCQFLQASTGSGRLSGELSRARAYRAPLSACLSATSCAESDAPQLVAETLPASNFSFPCQSVSAGAARWRARDSRALTGGRP